MTEADTVLYVLSGLVACYWAGYKFGVIVKVIKDLGSSA